MRHIPIIIFLVCLITTLSCAAEQAVTMNPKDIQMSEYRHKELPPTLLKRIKVTTDTFEIIDGISYEAAVDLYKRDLHPEKNLVLWEEMVKGYKTFCVSRCKSPQERMDVYRLLLLRSMFNEEESLKRANLKVLKPSEAIAVLKLYRLPPQPIDVVNGQ